MHLLKGVHAPLLYLLAAFALLRLLVIPHFGLGVDEAHYVLYAKHLSLSYFDHPPLVGWTQFLFTSLFGDGETGARIGAVIIGFGASWLVYALLLRVGASTPAALLGALALNASFLFNALFMMLLPDTLLFVLLIPVLFAVLRVETQNSVRNWIVLGALLGLAGLAKYTAVLFLFPIALYFLSKRRFDLFVTPKMIPGLLVALLLISPVVLWNMQHDWVSFTYQSGHVVGSDAINWLGFGQSIAAQFIAYSPLLYPVAFYGLYRAFKSPDDLLRLCALFGAVMLAFFTYASLYKPALPHWTAPFFLLFIPIGGYFLYEAAGRSRTYIKAAVAFSLTITALLYAELAFKFLPFGDYNSLHRDIYGFDTVMKEANALVKEPEKQVLAVTNWTLASRALYYNAPFKSRLYLLDARYDQFDFWLGEPPLGKEVIFITTKFFKKEIARSMRCDAVTQLKRFDITLHGEKVNTFTLTACTNFQGVYHD